MSDPLQADQRIWDPFSSPISRRMDARQRWVLVEVTRPVHSGRAAGNGDGKGESIGDRFARTPGTIKNDDTGDVANDP